MKLNELLHRNIAWSSCKDICALSCQTKEKAENQMGELLFNLSICRTGTCIVDFVNSDQDNELYNGFLDSIHKCIYIAQFKQGDSEGIGALKSMGLERFELSTTTHWTDMDKIYKHQGYKNYW